MEKNIAFEKKIIGAFGEDGANWLERLEEVVQHYLDKWNLVSEGPVENLSYNYVLFVKDKENTPLILKLGVPNFDFTNEYRTLKHYDGNGCVKVVKEDASKGAFLLERLEPGNMLFSLEEEQAVRTYAKVWKELRKPIRSTETFPPISNWFEAFNRYLSVIPKDNRPIPEKKIVLAKHIAQELLHNTEENQLLHGDLHHQNILYSKKHGWLAIDPKGVVGDCYFDFPSFLINELLSRAFPIEILTKRVDILVEELKLNREKLMKASFAMSILYACWAIEDKADWKEAYQCAIWFEKFLEE